jgi:hypothetical protein
MPREEIPVIPVRPQAIVMQKKGTTVTSQWRPQNSSDPDRKPTRVRQAWDLLEKMDPTGSLFHESRIIFVKGEKNFARSIQALGLNDQQRANVLNFAIEYGTDGAFTAYQAMELMYALGVEDGKNQAAEELTSVILPEEVEADDDDDADDDESDEDSEYDDEAEDDDLTL